MEKIIEKYKNIKSVRKICVENNIDYSNYLKGNVPIKQKAKVLKCVKKEIIKLLKEGVLDE